MPCSRTGTTLRRRSNQTSLPQTYKRDKRQYRSIVETLADDPITSYPSMYVACASDIGSLDHLCKHTRYTGLAEFVHALLIEVFGLASIADMASSGAHAPSQDFRSTSAGSLVLILLSLDACFYSASIKFSSSPSTCLPLSCSSSSSLSCVSLLLCRFFPLFLA